MNDDSHYSYLSPASQEDHEVEPEARVLDLIQQLPQFDRKREKRIWNRAYTAPNLSREVDGAAEFDRIALFAVSSHLADDNGGPPLLNV